MLTSRPMRTYLRLMATAVIVFGLTLTTSGQSGAPADLGAANLAWERGDYPTALEGYLALLTGPSGAEVLEPIALQTGELYVTDELASDGVAPRFSPDGQHIAYEVGAGSNT